MVATIDTEGRGCLTIDIVGAASTAAGGQGEIDNPEGVTLLVTKSMLYVEESSTGACNISIGIDTTGGTFNDIINALSVASVDGKVYNGHARQNTTKTEITVPALWTAAKKLGITASATMVGFVGKLLVEYIRLE